MVVAAALDDSMAEAHHGGQFDTGRDLERLGEGAAIVNVASMAAYMLPDEMIPTSEFPQAMQDPDTFMADMLAA
jgi:hypothetical protein